MPEMTLGITGLHEILSRDYGIEGPIGDPLYRIAFAQARNLYHIKLLFTRHKNGDCDAFFLQRRKAVQRRSLKWSVTYRIG